MWLIGVLTLNYLLAAAFGDSRGQSRAARRNVETLKPIAANALKMVNIPKYVAQNIDLVSYAEVLPIIVGHDAPVS